MQVPPESDCVAVSVKVFDRILEGISQSQSEGFVSESSDCTSDLGRDRLMGEVMILREDLLGNMGKGGRREEWLELRQDSGKRVRGGRGGVSQGASLLVSYAVVGSTVEQVIPNPKFETGSPKPETRSSKVVCDWNRL